ncbi:MAG: TraM recognition domain-containing protein [Deltaproteobacteria bacterium]|nr:TraM recognition domain-containing protein [Deltaproteobacteria bacterium]
MEREITKRTGDENSLRTILVKEHLRLLVKKEGDLEKKSIDKEPGSLIGFAEKKGGRTPFYLPGSSRNLHLYISGKPGTGKSTLLLNLALKDILCGRGCCVIDPHGDLVENILEQIPDQTKYAERIMVFDPSDVEHPIGLNILQDVNVEERDSAVQFMISLFNKLYLADHMGPMFFQAIRNGLLLIMENQGTLSDLPLIFEDDEYLKAYLRNCETPRVRNYFEKVWKKWGNDHKSEYSAYYSSKFSHFIDDRMLRNILCQRQGLDIKSLLNGNRIILVNLSRGKIGDLNSKLLGLLMAYSLERSMMRRAEVPENERTLFNVYIDEFQEFTTSTLDTFLSAARKYKVGLHLANQSLHQLPKEFNDAVLSNIGTFVIFRQGMESARVLSNMTYPKFDERDLARIPDYYAVIHGIKDGRYQDPNMIHIKAPSSKRDREVAKKLNEISKLRHGKDRKIIEQEILTKI